MKPPSPIQNPAPPPRIGPNWKLIRNLFIIAGLLIAISIVWDLRHETKTRRERENSRIVAKQVEEREKAIAKAREKSTADIRKRETEPATPTVRVNPIIPSEPNPPVVTSSNPSNNSSFEKPVQTPPDIVEPELPPEIVSLNSKARDLVAAAGRKRDEQLVANARKLSWDLDSYVRGLAKSEQSYWQPHVNRVKNSIGNNHVPESLESSDVDLSKNMAELLEYASSKQKQIKQGYLVEVAKIQSAYLKKLGEAATQAETSGQKPLAKMLKSKSADAVNLESWIRSLGAD